MSFVCLLKSEPFLVRLADFIGEKQVLGLFLVQKSPNAYRNWLFNHCCLRVKNIADLVTVFENRAQKIILGGKFAKKYLPRTLSVSHFLLFTRQTYLNTRSHFQRPLKHGFKYMGPNCTYKVELKHAQDCQFMWQNQTQ